MKRSKKIAAIMASLTTVVATAFATISATPAHASDSDTSAPRDHHARQPERYPVCRQWPDETVRLPCFYLRLDPPRHEPAGSQ